MTRRHLRVILALFAVLALFAAACSSSEGAARSTTTTTEATSPTEADDGSFDEPGVEAPPTTVNPEAEAADHTEFCDVFNELDERFSQAEGTDQDAVDLAAGMERLATAAPEYLKGDAELIATETKRVLDRARDEGVEMNDVPVEWFDDSYEDAAGTVFSTAYERCGLPDELVVPDGEQPTGR